MTATLYHYLDINKDWVSVSIENEVGAGDKPPPQGLTGRVFPIQNSHLVAKLYKANVLDRVRRELSERIIIQSMHYKDIATFQSVPLAWPIGPLFTRPILDDTYFCGYVMPAVRNPFPVEEFFTEDFLVGKPVTRRVKMSCGRNIAQAVAVCHTAGFVIGDLNSRNVIVSGDTLLPTLIDCDSYQFSFKQRQFLTREGTIDYASPTLLRKVLSNKGRFEGIKRDKSDDEFSLAVLIFQLLLNGLHPFDTQNSGVLAASRKDSILRRTFPYHKDSKHHPPRHAERSQYDALSFALRSKFETIFVSEGTVSAAEWVTALSVEAALPTRKKESGQIATRAWLATKRKLFNRLIFVIMVSLAITLIIFRYFL